SLLLLLGNPLRHDQHLPSRLERKRHQTGDGSDRRLNAALHRIIITRWRTHPDTLAYATRRRTQGLTDRDIRRCLKRIIARHIYRLLEAG
ncbi:hypothetical protein ACIQLJ_13580, partial [Microbacterium sp. NPDC091313]